MTTINIEELKAKAEAVKAANAKKLQEKVQVALLQATIEREGSEALLNARAAMEARRMQTERLQSLVQECAGIVSEVPVYNRKTRENRAWSGKLRYGYGSQINLVHQLMTGILYACQEHKDLMLAHTGLNMELVEQAISGFGIPSYYNRINNAIVEETPYNLEQVQEVVQILQSDMDLVIDTSELNQKNFDKEFLRAKENAETAFEQAQKAIEQADFTL